MAARHQGTAALFETHRLFLDACKEDLYVTDILTCWARGIMMEKSNLTVYLAGYAAYHRDGRNIATHLVGIPLIMLAVAILLSRPEVGGVSPALLVGLGLAAFYVRLDLMFGIGMAFWLGLTLWAGSVLAAQSTAVWLAAGVCAFIVGWVIQFVGHAFEGRKPAFLDDIGGLAIGPLFILAEVSFAAGLRRGVRNAVALRLGAGLHTGQI